MSKEMTYNELIKMLNELGFESVGTSDATTSKRNVFLRHRRSGDVLTLPTVDRTVLPPHLIAVKKILAENGMLAKTDLEFGVQHH